MSNSPQPFFLLLRQLLHRQDAACLRRNGAAARRLSRFSTSDKSWSNSKSSTDSTSSSADPTLPRPADTADAAQQTAPTSIYHELFPGDWTRATADKTTPTQTLPTAQNDWDDDLQRWLAVDGARDDGPPRGTAPVHDPTVLVLAGTTPSLLPSDFFRIAPRPAERVDDGAGHRLRPRGRPVEGWAAAGGGLYKVVQDRDPATLAPRGRYFLCFGAAAAALAYAQEVRDLHGRARRAVQTPRHRNTARFAFAGSSGSSGRRATAAEAAALRVFSLLPPLARLDLAMHLPEKRGSSSGGGGGGDGEKATAAQHTADHDADHDPAAAAADARTKVLLVLDSNTGTDPGSGTTIAALRHLIAADGVTRNLPWAVPTGLNGVVPVPWLVAEQRRRDKKRQAQAQAHPSTTPGICLPAAVPNLLAKTAQMDERAAFSRFVITLPDAVEARRFVRSWHRRRVTLPRPMAREEAEAGESPGIMTAVVEATVLW